MATPRHRKLLGHRWGHMVVVREGGHIGKAKAWVCLCDCGGERIFRTGDITKESFTHCGCRNRRRVTRLCVRCGEGFLVKKSDPKIYCTLSCYKASRPPRVELTCDHCGGKFDRGAADAKSRGASGKVFCGRGCLNAAKIQWESLPVRFWRSVDKSEGCWTWRGASAGRGYGSLHHDKQSLRAHRVSWELTHGPISGGLWVLHKCDNPACVRPDHLFLGTAKDNAVDRERKGRGHRKNIWPHQPIGKLNEPIVWAIRLIAKHRLAPMHVIANRFRISITAARKAVRGHSWKHVE